MYKWMVFVLLNYRLTELTELYDILSIQHNIKVQIYEKISKVATQF